MKATLSRVRFIDDLEFLFNRSFPRGEGLFRWSRSARPPL
jgi:hypothetical protein